MNKKYTLFCRATKSILAKKNWPDDYKGISVTKNSGFALPKNFMVAVEKGLITLSETKDTQQNLRKLIAQHADCYVNDDIAIEIELARMKKAGEYKPE